MLDRTKPGKTRQNLSEQIIIKVLCSNKVYARFLICKWLLYSWYCNCTVFILIKGCTSNIIFNVNNLTTYKVF